jgi:hypothetical protein
MNKVILIRYVFIFFLCSFILVIFAKEMIEKSKIISYERKLSINEIMVYNRNSIKDRDGDFSDWIEIHNQSEEEINLDGFGLTDNTDNLFKWKFVDVVIQPNSFLLVWASGKNRNDDIHNLHTNFKLGTNDDVVILTSPDESWSDIALIEDTDENISYGRRPDGGEAFYTFHNGTPRKSNDIDTLIDGILAKRLEQPTFSVEGGIYESGFSLTITSNIEGSSIYYTMNGEEPNKRSLNYKEPIFIDKNNNATVIRAIVTKKGYQDSNIITHSYFVNEVMYQNKHIPIVSIVTDPYNLYDYKKGIYVSGRIYDEWLEKNSEVISNIPANYTQKGKDWERSAHVEIFGGDNITVMNQNIGIRISGGFSRAKIIKSLSLYARKSYDDKDFFLYDFSDNGNKTGRLSLSKLVLRTPSTDALGSFFRDDLIQGFITDDLNLDTQKSNTCIVFINGEYFGIQSIKEAYNKEYLSSYYNIPTSDVVILKNPTGTAGIEISDGFVGDEMHYNRMYQFIYENDMSIHSNYEYIKTLMDVDNFMEYNILQIYSANRDWPGNNVKVWRQRAEKYNETATYGRDGRWRWLVFDLDYGLGLYSKEHSIRYSFDMLDFATKENGPIWPNPPWSTVMLRSLLKNNDFKLKFINKFADRLNTIYSENNVLDEITRYKNIYANYVNEHIKRWNIFKNDITLWESEIKILEEFALNRPWYVREQIIKYFNLTGLYQLNIEQNEGGIVKVNSITINNKFWNGIYFKGIDIVLEAIPNEGYHFVIWHGDKMSSNNKIIINGSKDLNLKVSFQKNLE